MLGDPKALDYSIRWARHNQWQGATEADKSKWKYKDYGEGADHVLFADWQTCFQTYIDLYNLAKKEGNTIGLEPSAKMLARAKDVMYYQMSTSANDYWWWADALYMAMPVMGKLYYLTTDEMFLDKANDYLRYTDSLLMDKETGLYYRDAKYVYPQHKTASGQKDFWARGNGWVMASLAKTLQEMNTYNRPHGFMMRKLQRMAATMAKAQHSLKATGLVPYSIQRRLPDQRPAARLSSRMPSFGASIAATWTAPPISPWWRKPGTTWSIPLCRPMERWATCSQ